MVTYLTARNMDISVFRSPRCCLTLWKSNLM